MMMKLPLAQSEQVMAARMEFLPVDRTHQVVGRARRERFVAVFTIFVGRDDHQRNFRMSGLLAEAADELGAIQTRHLEVGKDEVRGVAGGPFQRRQGIGEIAGHCIRGKARRKPRQQGAVGTRSSTTRMSGIASRAAFFRSLYPGVPCLCMFKIPTKMHV